MRANRAATSLLEGEVIGRDIAASLRNPQLIEAVEQTLDGAGGRDIEFTLPAPVERTFAARVEPLPEPREGGRRPAARARRLHGGAPHRPDAGRFRRQREPRDQDAARHADGVHRDPSRLGPRRCGGARALSLAIMDQHGKRMARLVDDLLSLSRIEMNEHTPPTDAVPLASLLANVQSTLAWRAEERGVTVAIDAEENLPAVIGDGDELTQVFLNLRRQRDQVRRGGGRSQRDGEAGLPKRKRPDGWRARRARSSVSVRGTGAPAFPREHLPRLTERFYRVDKARSPRARRHRPRACHRQAHRQPAPGVRSPSTARLAKAARSPSTCSRSRRRKRMCRPGRRNFARRRGSGKRSQRRASGDRHETVTKLTYP